MKKTLILAAALMFASATISFAADTTPAAPQVSQPCVAGKPAPPCCKKPPKNEEFKKRHEQFEKRLKLTDEQKAKAEQIRQKGHEQMKPIIDKIQEKKAEIEAVKRSKLAAKAQQEKIEQLHKDIRALKKEAHELRMQNMKEFESILTAKQQKELKKMKEEGRKKFEKEHRKNGHPCGPKPKEPMFNRPRV